MSGEKEFPFSCGVRPRFRDLDPMGHVNNAVYFTYFELARTMYFRSLGLEGKKGRPFGDLFPFILLKIECRFISPAGLDDALKVLLRVPKIGNKSFDFEYMIVSEPDGREIAEGSSVQVYYDYAAGRTRPIPERFRRLLERSAGKKRTSSAPRRMVDKIIPQARRVRG